MRLNHRQPSFQDKATPCQGPKSIQWGNNRAFRGEECENLVQATGRHRIDVRADATLPAAPGNGNSSQAGLWGWSWASRSTEGSNPSPSAVWQIRWALSRRLERFRRPPRPSRPYEGPMCPAQVQRTLPREPV